jgi:hypothetical protein
MHFGEASFSEFHRRDMKVRWHVTNDPKSLGVIFRVILIVTIRSIKEAKGWSHKSRIKSIEQACIDYCTETMSIVEQIKENDPELKEIRFAEDPLAYSPTVAELCDAFASNTVISYVRLDRDFLPSMDEEDIGPFFEAFSKLPALIDAQIWHASIPVSILASFIKAAKQLENLQLGCLELEGEENDFSLINEAIKGHPSLKSFTMSDL